MRFFVWPSKDIDTTDQSHDCHPEELIYTDNSHMIVDRSYHEQNSQGRSQSDKFSSEEEKCSCDKFNNSRTYPPSWFHADLSKQFYWLWMSSKLEIQCLEEDECCEDASEMKQLVVHGID